jgi:hypothetical protein
MHVTKTTLATCTTSRLWVLAAALVAAAGLAVPAARADGDPASDYLLSGQSFLSPFDGHISAADSQGLEALLASAKAQGFPLKLALIVTPYDLGAVPILFNKPQTYAKFLGEEDYYYWKDELLVVMPKGYGIYKGKNLPATDKAVIAALPAPAAKDGPALAAAAERAVRALAAKHGITLSDNPAGSAGGSSAWVERGEIVGAVVLAGLLALAARFFWRRRSRKVTV